MIDPPTISEDDEEYFYEIVIASPDKDKLLQIIQEDLWYQMHWHFYPACSRMIPHIHLSHAGAVRKSDF